MTMDSTDRITDLIAVVGRLADLLARENTALREHKTHDVAALAEEKKALCRSYEARVKALHENPDDLAEASPELRARLRGLGEKAATLMDDNASLLKVAIATSHRVVDLIAEAAKENLPGPGTYSPSGAAAGGGQGGAPRAAPVSVDQSL